MDLANETNGFRIDVFVFGGGEYLFVAGGWENENKTEIPRSLACASGWGLMEMFRVEIWGSEFATV